MMAAMAVCGVHSHRRPRHGMHGKSLMKRHADLLSSRYCTRLRWFVWRVYSPLEASPYSVRPCFSEDDRGNDVFVQALFGALQFDYQLDSVGLSMASVSLSAAFLATLWMGYLALQRGRTDDHDLSSFIWSWCRRHDRSDIYVIAVVFGRLGWYSAWPWWFLLNRRICPCG